MTRSIFSKRLLLFTCRQTSKYLKKVLFTLLAIFSLFGYAVAQNRTITGRVTDDKGQGVPRASVVVKGTNVGTTTNNEGAFSLSVPSNARSIVVSYIGLADKEIDLTGNTSYQVNMTASSKADMQEVVVVAYGTSKKGALTNSVSQVTAKDLENRPVTNVITALAGVAPGINTSSNNGQPGSTPAIRIRGFGSINASSSPLIVVDGFPYDYDISNINVDDIENVSILKDAAASALYGSRAANGVVQITTKKGRKDRTQIQGSVAQGFVSRALPEYDRINALQYYPVMWESYRNSLVYPISGIGLPIDTANKIATGLMPRNAAGLQIYSGKTYSDISQLLGYNPFNVSRTDIVGTNGQLNPIATLLYPDDLDWLKEIQRNGIRGDYSVSFSGGAAKSDYYISLGYTNEKGFVKNSDYQRYSARLNLNTQALNWFKTGVSLAAIVTEANQGASDGSSTGLVNPFYANRIIGPIYPVYAHDASTGAFLLDASGNKFYDLGNLGSLGGIYGNRPIAGGRHAIYETILNENTLKRNVLNGRAYGEVSFLKNFKLTANFSADISNSLRSQFENKIVGDGAPSGRSRRNSFDNLTITINQLLNYNKTFGNHSLDVLVGHENFDATYRSLTNLRTGQVLEGNTELVNFTTTTSLTSFRDQDRIESYLSRVNYGFNNKYFLSGSFRRDASARFSQAVRNGNFWSAGAGWRIDQEAFLTKINWISALKLRASYGEVGNNELLSDVINNISNYYAYQNFYNLGSNNNTEPGAALSTSIGNPDLTWEVNNQFDVAVEFGLFKNRLNGTLEFFNRESTDLLFNVTPPVSSGALSAPQNIGAMYNRGFEVSLNGDIVKNKNFIWNTTINWTTFKNKVTKLPTQVVQSPNTTIQQLEVGRDRYQWFVRDWYGVDPADGAGLYRMNVYSAATAPNVRVLKNGDSVTVDHNNAKYHYAGSAIPDFFGAVINTFSYKNFSLFFQLNFSVGGKIYDQTYAQLMHAGTYGTALHVDILRRWQKPGDETDVPRLDAGQITRFGAASDRWLTDASFLNVQNVTFSMLMPKRILEKAGLQNMRFYVSGENLHMFTKRKGMNPSQNFTGLTSNVYIPAKTITAGISLSL